MGATMRKLVVFGAALMLVVVGMAGVADAKGGNSSNAQRCYKNGWADLVTSTGQSFTSEEACTSYAAMGGALLTRRDYWQGQFSNACTTGGGAFWTATHPGTSVSEWVCHRNPGGFDSTTASLLSGDCSSAGGVGFFLSQGEIDGFCQFSA